MHELNIVQEGFEHSDSFILPSATAQLGYFPRKSLVLSLSFSYASPRITAISKYPSFLNVGSYGRFVNAFHLFPTT